PPPDYLGADAHGAPGIAYLGGRSGTSLPALHEPPLHRLDVPPQAFPLGIPDLNLPADFGPLAAVLLSARPNGATVGLDDGTGDPEPVRLRFGEVQGYGRGDPRVLTLPAGRERGLYRNPLPFRHRVHPDAL